MFRAFFSWLGVWQPLSTALAVHFQNKNIKQEKLWENIIAFKIKKNYLVTSLALMEKPTLAGGLEEDFCGY